MPFIAEIPPERAVGDTKREYDDAMRRSGRVWHIVSIMSQNGPVMRNSMRLSATLMHGASPLSRAQREMIAVVTSQANDCFY